MGVLESIHNKPSQNFQGAVSEQPPVTKDMVNAMGKRDSRKTENLSSGCFISIKKQKFNRVNLKMQLASFNNS